MSHTAFIATLVSSLLHALWNYWLKAAHDQNGTAFASGYLIALVGLPGFLLWGQPRVLDGPMGLLVLLSGLCHVAYRSLLAATYRRSDLSQAYPVARSAPVLVALLAVPLLGERISGPGWLGIGLTVLGLYLLYARELRGLLCGKGKASGLGFALLTMVAVTLYSLVDKASMNQGRMHPAAFFYAAHTASILLYSAALPVLKGQVAAMRRALDGDLGRIVGIGVLEPLSYILILWAFTVAQVSYVVCVRQLSVVMAAAMGVWLLREPAGPARLVGAAVTVGGVVLVRLFG